MKISRTLFVLAFAALVAVGNAQSILATPLNANNGQSGVMFDLNTTQPVLVTGFDINIDAGNWNVALYVRTGGGTFLGQQAVAASWTLVGSANIVGAGLNLFTPLPIPAAIFVNPGIPQGIYITATVGTGMNYTTGAAGTFQNTLVTDGTLSITSGLGCALPLFTGGNFGGLTPGVSGSRQFGGRVYYGPATPPNNGTGQAPQAGLATLNVNDARDVDNFPVATGGNGPYSVNVTSGNNMAFRFGGAANQPIIFLAGPLNINSASFPVVGQLDIGTPNGGIPTDIQVLADGASLAGFLPEFFVLDGTGNRTITLASGAAAGVTLTFQCAMLTGGPAVIALSNAVTVNIL